MTSCNESGKGFFTKTSNFIRNKWCADGLRGRRPMEWSLNGTKSLPAITTMVSCDDGWSG
jgi:hypothetical protein